MSGPSVVFDADNHMYEAPEMLEQYVPAEYRGDVLFLERKGRKALALRGRLLDFIPNPDLAMVAAPGAHHDFFVGKNEKGKSLRELTGGLIPTPPSFREPGPRLELMDEQGLNAALMLPSLANLIEVSVRDDGEFAHMLVHAMNEWIADVWGFSYQNRIFSVPLIPLHDVDKAIAELEWVLRKGARAILVSMAPVRGPYGWRSMATTDHDPFWSRVQDAGVLVIFHTTYPVLMDYARQWEGKRTTKAFQTSPMREMATSHRDIQDALAAMIVQGALSRHPRLRVASIENGTDWLPHFFKNLKRVYGQMPQEFSEHPLDTFQRNVWINPFWEEDIDELVGLVDIERILFGSDYPHPEGLADPRSYAGSIGHLGTDAVQKIMHDNLASLVGV